MKMLLIVMVAVAMAAAVIDAVTPVIMTSVAVVVVVVAALVSVGAIFAFDVDGAVIVNSAVMLVAAGGQGDGAEKGTRNECWYRQKAFHISR
jgi:hypothetical protein